MGFRRGQNGQSRDCLKTAAKKDKLDLREAALIQPVLAEFMGTRAGGLAASAVSLVCLAARRRAGAAVALETAPRVGRRCGAPGWGRAGGSWGEWLRRLVVAAAAGEPGTPEPAPSLGGAEWPWRSGVPLGPRCTPPPRSPADGGSRGGPGMTRRRSTPTSWLLVSLLGE